MNRTIWVYFAEHGIPDFISFMPALRARNPVFWPKRGIKNRGFRALLFWGINMPKFRFLLSIVLIYVFIRFLPEAWKQSTESPILMHLFCQKTGLRARNAGMNDIKSGIPCSAWKCDFFARHSAVIHKHTHWDHYSDTPATGASGQAWQNIVNHFDFWSCLAGWEYLIHTRVGWLRNFAIIGSQHCSGQSPKSPIPDLSFLPSNCVSCPHDHL